MSLVAALGITLPPRELERMSLVAALEITLPPGSRNA
ncbi:MAG: hypothetical protein QOH97_280 [Actinoplanes sp.]|jgi:hypothetical protein|nr:hypothetical protein [Actinoplanes sp.]